VSEVTSPSSVTTGSLERAGYLALAAVVVYVTATVLGSVLDPSYSQVRQHVSDLTATGASTWAALAPLYVLYNLLVAAFSVGFYRASPRDGLWTLGTALLVANASAGVLMVTAFREDIGGVPTTSAGTGHLVLAGLSSLAIVASALVFWIAFRRSALWRPLAPISLGVGLGFAILGPVAAIATAHKSDLAGLAERGPIGLFLLWLVIVGCYGVILGRRVGSR
jgi:Protein of unknown function (DUF998)